MPSSFWVAKIPEFFTGDTMYRRSFINTFKCLGAVASLFCAASTWAAYPERTVTLVVPFTPGSGSDIIARIIAPKLSERWKQAVVVDNKPGASGNIGADAVAKAAPESVTGLAVNFAPVSAPKVIVCESAPTEAVGEVVTTSASDEVIATLT
jgi:tripartite-type tricarboxylate transporter receptor subunit TctC